MFDWIIFLIVMAVGTLVVAALLGYTLCVARRPAPPPVTWADWEATLERWSKEQL